MHKVALGRDEASATACMNFSISSLLSAFTGRAPRRGFIQCLKRDAKAFTVEAFCGLPCLSTRPLRNELWRKLGDGVRKAA